MPQSRTAPTQGAVFLSPNSSDLCLIVRYDGTDYHGFQKQPRAHTIQGELERVLTGLMGPGRVLGASRTDSGVHAAGQVAVWRGPITIPVARIPEVMNHRLAPAVRIREAWLVAPGWDPRRAARAKQYSYRVWRGPEPPTLAWQRLVVPAAGPLDWQRLQAAAARFLGTHDFRAFRTEGSSAETTVRRILASGWHMEEHGRIWRYQVIGDGFLYRMVRHMAGSMLKAAEPGGSLMEIESGLADPSAKVPALAPASGLMLDWIQC